MQIEIDKKTYEVPNHVAIILDGNNFVLKNVVVEGADGLIYNSETPIGK